MKKAFEWLQVRKIAYEFHDYKKLGLDRATLEGWVARVGWEVLLNRSGTTFRKLPDLDRTDVDTPKAIALMLAQPSMVKRPVLDTGSQLLVGFRQTEYEALL